MKTFAKRLALCSLALTATLSLAGCSSSTHDNTYPIGVGTGPNSLKLSPCASLDTTKIPDGSENKTTTISVFNKTA